MTVRTVGKRDRPVLHEGLGLRVLVGNSPVTLLTGHLGVSPPQGEASLLVAELDPLPPLHEPMAFLAVPTLKLAAVLVEMTGATALSLEPEEGPIQILVLSEQGILAMDE
jgi:hypothetical protein